MAGAGRSPLGDRCRHRRYKHNKTEDISMIAEHDAFPVDMKRFVRRVERRMRAVDQDIERAKRELGRLRLYRDVVRRLNSQEALMPEVIRSQELDL